MHRIDVSPEMVAMLGPGTVSLPEQRELGRLFVLGFGSVGQSASMRMIDRLTVRISIGRAAAA